MADSIESVSAMLKGGNDPELEQRQRRQRDLALLGMMSGSRPMQSVGAILYKSAEDEAERRAEKAKRRYLGQGFIMESDGSVTRDEGMAAAELEREQRLLSRMGYQNDLIANRPRTQLVPTEGGYQPLTVQQGGGGATVTPGATVPVTAPTVKPTAAQEEDSRRWSGVMDDLSTLSQDVKQAPSINDPKRAAGVAAAGWIAPKPLEGIARNYATEKLYPKDELPTVIGLRQKFHSVLQAMSGLATTDSERANLQSWAAAEGQGPAAMQAAINEMRNYAASRARAATGRPYAGGSQSSYPAPSSGAVEWERGPDGRPRRKQ